MNLVIDQGNSYFKVGIFSQNELLEHKRYGYDQLDTFNTWIKHHNIDQVIISSVVDQIVKPEGLSENAIIILDHTTPLPITNGYSTPKTLGNDRLANAVAAWAINPQQNNLVIDGGTCIKYDLISKEGRYLGGAIAPGINMRYQALHSLTDQLPKLNPVDIDFTYGIDSESSIHTGVISGINHEINGFIRRYQSEFEQLTIFMTGGDAKYFDKTDKKPIFAIQNLTLIGLNEILNYNVKQL